jgi:hypothetical protein
MINGETVGDSLWHWEALESVLSKVGTGRVKYSCLDASSDYLVLGANTGSLYFFEVQTQRFVTLINAKELREPISHIKFNSSGTLLGIATSKSTVCVLELSLLNRKDPYKVINKFVHREEITCLQWDKGALFLGDVLGGVHMTALNPRLTKLVFSNLECVFKCDSAIVQLSTVASQAATSNTSAPPELLLISSMTRSTILNLAKRTSAQVGTQLRDGRCVLHSGHVTDSGN